MVYFGEWWLPTISVQSQKNEDIQRLPPPSSKQSAWWGSTTSPELCSPSLLQHQAGAQESCWEAEESGRGKALAGAVWPWRGRMCPESAPARVCERLQEICAGFPADSLDEEPTARMMLEWSCLLCSLVSTEAQEQQILWTAKLSFPLLVLTCLFLKFVSNGKGNLHRSPTKSSPAVAAPFPQRKDVFH